MIFDATLEENNHILPCNFDPAVGAAIGAVRYTEQNLTEEQKAQARKNIGACDTNLFAYNFTTLNTELTWNPKDAEALHYIVENWDKVPMSIYVQGYPVIGIDLNDRYMRVLQNDRCLYSFRWQVEGHSMRLAAHALVKLIGEGDANRNFVGINEQAFTPEQQAQARKNIGAASAENDYIVEQGRSDNGWDYCKWASGKAECWKNVTATVKTTDWKDSGMMSFLSYGLFWTSGILIEFPYPFAFTEHPTETAMLSNGTVWFPLSLISTTHLQTDKTDSYRICTYKVPDKDINVKIALHVVGKWKTNKEEE